MKYWDIRDGSEEGIFITFESHREAQEWLDDHMKRYPEYVLRNGMHIVECERQTLSEKCLAQQQEIEQHIKWNAAHTKARVEQSEEIEQLKAQAAVLMKALKGTAFFYDHDDEIERCMTCGEEMENHKTDCIVGKALSEDAGKDLLAELEQYRKEAEKRPGICFWIERDLCSADNTCPAICPHYSHKAES